MLGESAVALGIELEPKRAAGGFGDVFNGNRRHSAEHHSRMGLASAARGGHFALRMRQPMQRRRGQQDWERQLLAEKRDPRIEPGNVVEHPRIEPDVVEGFAVPAHGDLIGGGAVNVFPLHVRHAAAGFGLKIKEADQLFEIRASGRQGNIAGGFLLLVARRSGVRQSSGGGHQGRKLQHIAAVRIYRHDGALHGEPRIVSAA